MRRLEPRNMLLDADARCHGECANVIAHATLARCDVIGETLVWLACWLALLLPQMVERQQHLTEEGKPQHTVDPAPEMGGDRRAIVDHDIHVLEARRAQIEPPQGGAWQLDHRTLGSLDAQGCSARGDGTAARRASRHLGCD